MKSIGKNTRAGYTSTLALALAGCGADAGMLESSERDEVAALESALSAPNDPKFNLQWALRNSGQTVPTDEDGFIVNVKGVKGVDLNVLNAWDSTQGSPTVTVAVIEEGEVDVTHQDLAANIFVNTGEVPNDGIDNDGNGYVDDVSGFDFRDGDGMNGPYSGHATHVAGIIAARSANGLGVAGVAPRVRILPIRAESGGPSMVQAIAYAKKMGAKVANVSQGGWFDYNVAVYNAIKHSGILFVCSAGNDGTGKYNYPSGYDLANVLSVANVDPAGRLSVASSYGENHVDIAAPGKGVLSTGLENSYEYRDGTSQSAPHVAGVAALLFSRFPSMTVADVANRILATGMKMSTLSGVVKSGAMVDANAALFGVPSITLSATSTTSRIVLSWNAQAGASRYDVERDGSLASSTSTTYTHSGLTAESGHVYRVRAIIGSTAGPWSQKLFKTASAPTTVQTFTQGTAHPYANNRADHVPVHKRNAKRLRVHFSKIDIAPGDSLWYPASNIESSEDNVLDGVYPSGFWTHWFGDTVDLWFRSDAANTAYGYSIDKIEYVLGIPDAPGMPEVWDIGPGYVQMAWVLTGGCLDTNIYRSTSNSSGYVKVANVVRDPEAFAPVIYGHETFTNLPAGKTYYYKVACRNDLGESPRSPALKVITQ